MRKPLIAALTAVLITSGCATVSESRLNPFNWFGGSQDTTTAEFVAPATPDDNRPLISQVTEMRIDRAPGGAIVHAVGLPPVQGYWAADLSPADDVEDQIGVLVLNFVTIPPSTQQPQGSTQSREITAALFLSDQDLVGVRTIIVRGSQNQRSSRRR